MQVEGVRRASSATSDRDLDSLVLVNTIDTSGRKEVRCASGATEDLQEDGNGGVSERVVVDVEVRAIL